MRALIAALVLLLSSGSGYSTDLFDRFAGTVPTEGRIAGLGFVTDGSHPTHPGDFTRYDLTLNISYNTEVGEADIEVGWEQDGKKMSDHYYFRRGRVFQVGDSLKEKETEPLGDISPATIAALHPVLLMMALESRRENMRMTNDSSVLVALHDEMWDVTTESTGRIGQVSRQTYSEVYGDGNEVVRYAGWPEENAPFFPEVVTVTARGRETAQFRFAAVEIGPTASIPAGDNSRDRGHAIARSEIVFTELAPNVYAIDLASQNTRVVIAEFADHLAVLEGAYSSQICDLIAQQTAQRFGKPVRYFAFSHLHGQYLGGTRSWVGEGATVLVPPTTAPLIEQVVNAPHEYRPDKLSRAAKTASVEIIEKSRTIGDSLNTLVVYNVESQHTDEYFIFYFPRQKLLMTGDLLFYREGKPLAGRSKKLCETVRGLELDVDRYIATWPLDGYGTKNIITRAEMDAVCPKD